MVLGIACFAVVMSVVMIVHRPSPLPPPLPSLGLPSQNQGAETIVYLLAFAVILPLAVVAARRLADTIFSRANGPALSVLAGLLTASLAVAVLSIKLLGVLHLGDGVRVVLFITALWWLGAAVVLRRAVSPRPWPALLRIAPFAVPTWGVAAVLVFGTLLCLTFLSSISFPVLVLGALAGAGVVAAHGRLGLPRPPRPWAVAADIAIVGLVLLAVPDLVIFRPANASHSLAAALQTGVIQFHQDFLLGPANELLHGGTMLVDTVSQYGVGSIYLLAGWFHLAPIGYGTLGFLDGALTALWFAAGYCVLRLAGASRMLTATALAIAVVALVFSLSYPVGALPQDGPLRFGLPMTVLLAVVAGERWPHRSRVATTAALLVVGISSIWSLEALAYTVAVFAAVSCLRAWLRTGPGRLRWLARQALLAAIACVCTHVAFAAATLAVSGQLPDWGQYLAYLHAFLFGGLGNLTYDVARWTPGLAVGAVYAASAAAIVELARRRGRFVQHERSALIALAGLTAYGIVLLSYYVDRSTGLILIHVSLPALLLAVLWLSVLLRSRETVSRATRRGGLAFGLAVGVLLVAVAWSSVGDRFPRSALAYAAPGGASLPGALHDLWHPTALNAAAPEGVRLLDRYMPGERRSLVVVSPDLGTEILIRSHRADKLFLSDPVEASFVAADRLRELGQTVSKLRPGDRMLIDAQALRLLTILRAHPSLDPLENVTAGGLLPRGLASLQQWALKRIGERFRLRPIHRDAQGFVVVELEARARRRL